MGRQGAWQSQMARRRMFLDAEFSSQSGVKEKAPGTYWRLQRGLSVRRRQIFTSQYLRSTL